MQVTLLFLQCTYRCGGTDQKQPVRVDQLQGSLEKGSIKGMIVLLCMGTLKL